MQGKSDKLVLEPLKFADDKIVSDVVMVESEPYLKIGRTHCL